MNHSVAIDIGASGGKMAIGHLEGSRLIIDEYRDFVNRPIDIGTALYWDVFSLYASIMDGLKYFREKYGSISTIGVDTWGATFGLLDFKGRLLEPVYHYRDGRTVNIMTALYGAVRPRQLFEWTGCQCNRTYTLPQLYAYIAENNHVLDFASRLLFLPDLLGYFLTGNDLTETTIAGTSGLLDRDLEHWSEQLIRTLQFPRGLFGTMTAPGCRKGTLCKRVTDETGIRAELVSVAEHDSASAVTAIPDLKKGDLYISTGTNISMGVESDSALTTLTAFSLGLKNTGGFEGRKIIYRDFSACWHINEFLRTCREQGRRYSYEEAARMADDGLCTGPWIDVEAPALNNAGGNFKKKINRYLLETNQRPLSEDEEFINCIYQSIAMKVNHYKNAFIHNNFSCSAIYAISGATRDQKLMQCFSNALGRPVMAGMPYASLSGNLLAQVYCREKIAGIDELRDIASESFRLKQYLPHGKSRWHENYQRYEEIMRHGAL